jgi:methionyl-tRNA formyltransferase
LKYDIAGMTDFLTRLLDGEGFPRLPQEGAKATYYSRLYTPAHGYIDWRWHGPEIERFICAFSHPYPGARSFTGKYPVTIFDAHFEASDLTLHPYFIGHVFRRVGDRIFIHVPGGSLVVPVQDVESKSSLLPGARFHTPTSYLDQAMSFRPVYTPTGLKNPL